MSEVTLSACCWARFSVGPALSLCIDYNNLMSEVTHSACCWAGSAVGPALSAWRPGTAAARGCSCSTGPATTPGS